MNDYDKEKYQKERQKRLKSLGGFGGDYTVQQFLIDFAVYFEDNPDIDLDKIQEEVEKPGKLKQLIAQAKENKTHPVSEFVKELFLDISEDQQ